MQAHLVTSTGAAACGAAPMGSARLFLTDAPDQVDCPACAELVGTVYTAHQLREELRAIMRAGGDAAPVEAATGHWWPGELLREVTEWHDAGQPTATETIAALERRQGGE